MSYSDYWSDPDLAVLYSPGLGNTRRGCFIWWLLFAFCMTAVGFYYETLETRDEYRIEAGQSAQQMTTNAQGVISSCV